MQFKTTDKHARQWETFKASAHGHTIVASVSKEGAGWNWFVRVSYLHTNGVSYIEEAQGREWSKPEARATFEARASELVGNLKRDLSA